MMSLVIVSAAMLGVTLSPALWGVWWGLAILGIAGSALCSGMEVGLYSINRVRLDLRSHRSPPDTNARIIQEEIAAPGRVLTALLIANTIFHALAAQASATLQHGSGLSDRAVTILNTVVLGPVLFVLSDALPKELFRVDADALTPLFARPLRWARVLLTVTGVIPLLTGISGLVERVFKLPRDSAINARQRVAALLRESAGQGAISDSQASLVDRALTFGSVTVGDEMTPWAKVRVLPVGAERSRMIELASVGLHAYLPCVDRAGKVAGVIRHIDLFAHGKRSTADLMQPVARLTSVTPAREALGKLRSMKSRIGVVEDATGRPIGIVTAKDLIEPLTGEIAEL